MERKFENSVLFDIKSYQGFIFSSIQIFDLLYNEKSEYRTPAIFRIIQRETFLTFANKLKTFGNGKTFESFESIYVVEQARYKDLRELRKLFVAVIDDLKLTYFQSNDYISYCYAVLIVSIIRATEGYILDRLLYKFLHFVRHKDILKI